MQRLESCAAGLQWEALGARIGNLRNSISSFQPLGSYRASPEGRSVAEPPAFIFPETPPCPISAQRPPSPDPDSIRLPASDGIGELPCLRSLPQRS